MADRRLPKNPPPPLEGGRIARHFEAIRSILWNQVELSGGYSPTVVGNAREFFIREFLSTHLPSCLRLGTGHVVCGDETSGQLDVIVYRDTGLALPLGSSGVYFGETVVATIEIKSLLSKDDLAGQIAANFSIFGHPQPLKVVVAARLDATHNRRGHVARWARDAGLSPDRLPDLVVLLNNSAIVRGATLQCLDGTCFYGTDSSKLYKLGTYDRQKWLGLTLLVFELAQRAGDVNWSGYLLGALTGQTDFAELTGLPE